MSATEREDDLIARAKRYSFRARMDKGEFAGPVFVRGALFKLLPYPNRMGPALRLAPLGRKLPLPGRLGAMTEIKCSSTTDSAPKDDTSATLPRSASFSACSSTAVAPWCL